MAATPPDAPFGIYVHWPFCAQKCPYCDFNSHVRREGVDEARYVAAFARELAALAALTGPRRVTSIFLGGGTPSLMAGATVAALLDHIAGLWTLDPEAEITLEANPGSVEAARFRDYRAAGVNRVSIGVQSLRDPELKRLGRIHSAAEARAAVAIAQDVFNRVSFDLIYARPGQSPDDWRTELADALTLAGGHLSLYQLTIEPDTAYAKLHAAGKLHIPNSDEAVALYELTQETMEAAGLPAYEISNHARPGEESRHNLLYWRYGEYVGAGPGAHGRVRVGGARHATVTERHPETWLAHVEARGNGLIENTPLSPAEQADEALLMGLRLREGLDLDRLMRLGGVQPSPDSLRELVGLGLLTHDPFRRWIAATAAGRLVLNAVVAHLSAGLVGAEGAVSIKSL